MELRRAIQKDTPEIVKILKASLGEQELPLSEDIWCYKHVLNPFGKSLVLVAEDNNKIIGVRAFMRWKWQLGEKNFSAFRAVDTATHPNHQGRGIFRKLTMKAVEIAKEEGNHYIFNTPNDKSRPGYLKMGWEIIDKIKVQLIFNNPIPHFNPHREESYKVIKNIDDLDLNNLINGNSKKLLRSGKIFTPKSIDYLKWRYEDNPLQSYEVFVDKNLFIAGYIKRRKNFRELRISEFICKGEFNSKLFRFYTKKWAKHFKANFISISGEIVTKDLFTVKGKYGPILTFKELDLPKKYKQDIKNIENWGYSLGDLELF